jgi:capsule polysaccharide export protein KpsC/LpsZ
MPLSEQHQIAASGSEQPSSQAAGRGSLPIKKITTYAFHIHEWKQDIFRRYFPDRSFIFVPMYVSEPDFEDWAARILLEDNPQIFVWSLRTPQKLKPFAAEHGIPVFFIEDGFIRSVVATASYTPPLSLALDQRTAYFDCREPSDLEQLFCTYDFDGAPELLERASAGIRFLLETGVSKYNSDTSVDIDRLYGPKSAKRILVIGQVEDDASIQFGCLSAVTNNDLVRLAAEENPGAQIIYKPHPDILNRVRLAQSNPRDVQHLCQIIAQPLSMGQAFETIDHVYTITSLAGFEALLRGLTVTVYGCPFYAGWGLTDDRQPNERRGRNLSIEALFAGAYLLYPRYFDPVSGKSVSFEETVDGISRHFAKEKREPEPARRSLRLGPPWRAWGPYGILGWRHLLTPPLAFIISKIGNNHDAQWFRQDPILFFREVSNPKFRLIGRVLYPFG